MRRESEKWRGQRTSSCSQVTLSLLYLLLFELRPSSSSPLSLLSFDCCVNHRWLALSQGDAPFFIGKLIELLLYRSPVSTPRFHLEFSSSSAWSPSFSKATSRKSTSLFPLLSFSYWRANSFNHFSRRPPFFFFGFKSKHSSNHKRRRAARPQNLDSCLTTRSRQKKEKGRGNSPKYDRLRVVIQHIRR